MILDHATETGTVPPEAGTVITAKVLGTRVRVSANARKPRATRVMPSALGGCLTSIPSAKETCRLLWGPWRQRIPRVCLFGRLRRFV